MVSFDGGSASKVDDVTALPSRHKMADMRYYGNVMTTTRWRICVTMATLWQQQDGGYALLWKRYENNDVPTFRWRILHLQQYSHRLNVFFFMFSPCIFKVNHFYLPTNALNCIKLRRLKSTCINILKDKNSDMFRILWNSSSGSIKRD